MGFGDGVVQLTVNAPLVEPCAIATVEGMKVAELGQLLVNGVPE